MYLNVLSPQPDPGARLPVMIWVHIESFGGDPDNITLIGESAGAGNISDLVATKLAEEPVYDRQNPMLMELGDTIGAIGPNDLGLCEWLGPRHGDRANGQGAKE